MKSQGILFLNEGGHPDLGRLLKVDTVAILSASFGQITIWYNYTVEILG